jgi:putative copper export protein
VLSPTAATVRLFLHVLAAAVWVGGQIVLAGLVPTLRAVAPESTKPVARAFARLAWPAYGLLLATGIWNLVEVDVSSTSSAYQATVFAKVALAIGAGAATLVHQLGRSKVALAVGGALALLCSLGAVWLGLLLRTGT